MSPLRIVVSLTDGQQDRFLTTIFQVDGRLRAGVEEEGEPVDPFTAMGQFPPECSRSDRGRPLATLVRRTGRNPARKKKENKDRDTQHE